MAGTRARECIQIPPPFLSCDLWRARSGRRTPAVTERARKCEPTFPICPAHPGIFGEDSIYQIIITGLGRAIQDLWAASKDVDGRAKHNHDGGGGPTMTVRAA